MTGISGARIRRERSVSIPLLSGRSSSSRTISNGSRVRIASVSASVCDRTMVKESSGKSERRFCELLSERPHPLQEYSWQILAARTVTRPITQAKHGRFSYRKMFGSPSVSTDRELMRIIISSHFFLFISCQSVLNFFGRAGPKRKIPETARNRFYQKTGENPISELSLLALTEDEDRFIIFPGFYGKIIIPFRGVSVPYGSFRSEMLFSA